MRPIRVQVPLGPRSYDVWIGSGVVARAASLGSPSRPGRRAFIIADQALVSAREALRKTLAHAGWDITEIAVQAGEDLKDFQFLYPLYGELLKSGADRNAVLFALGGGSVGDAAGFIAATYMRGIQWVSVPTTLLAQVDSAVGGKTGVNHSLGKNLIGAFYQPSLVLCDSDFLKTLSSREVVSGLGETIKYGIIYDPSFCTFLRKNLKPLLALEPRILTQAVARSIRWKAKAVARDELDRNGVREALNFGHTFGHALESATGYHTFQHGEAVIWGMRFALALSQVCKKLKATERSPLEKLLTALPIPPLPQALSETELFLAMQKDKKNRNGKIHFVLLKKPGKTVTSSDVTERELVEAYRMIASASLHPPRCAGLSGNRQAVSGK
jgi:3-dehydroquinate synthase